MRKRWFYILFAFTCANVFADERVRQVQEELRKRNLYFGDIDGQPRPELASALRRYQTRKGFAVTGTIDEETAVSLSVATPSSGIAERKTTLPDVPVLRSDRARELPAQQRLALEKQADQNPDYVSPPPAPAESPPPLPDVTPERIRSLVQQYLQDGEGSDIAAQTKYFAYPVEYFDHGAVNAAFVNRDVTNYVKRWPERKYALQEPIDFMAADQAGVMAVRFPITFQVRNKEHAASGRTMNFWTLKREGTELRIVAIREQRLRD